MKATYQAHGFVVTRTDANMRSRSRGDYIACINPADAARQHLGAMAVISRTVSDHNGNSIELRATCRVVLDRTVPIGSVALDQSVRNAVGIRFFFDEKATWVGINPVKVRWVRQIRERLAIVLGTRYLYMRACLADIPDMEKHLVRIHPDAFTLLGIRTGGRIVVETVTPQEVVDTYDVAVASVAAYELTPEISARREELQETDLGARYPDPEGLLGLPEDIWPIYIDAQKRAELGGIGSLHVVKVRRDFWDLFQVEFREFGVVFFVSLFTIVSVLPVSKSWGVVAAVSAGSLVVAALAALVNMRAKSGT